jgi:uncharacterized membrane protein
MIVIAVTEIVAPVTGDLIGFGTFCFDDDAVVGAAFGFWLFMSINIYFVIVCNLKNNLASDLILIGKYAGEVTTRW